MQQHITLKGFVIRETDFGEYDRYVTVLAIDGRKVEVLCRGIRRKSSRIANAVRLFCYSELTLYQNRGKYTLNDASVIMGFWEVTQNIERYALACYFSELLNIFTDDGEVVPDIAKLGLYALRALCDEKYALPLVKAAFELRILAISGFSPMIQNCGACKSPLETAYFSVAESVAVCGDCAKRIGGDWKPLAPGVLEAMRFVLTADIKKVFLFRLGEASAKQMTTLSEQYILYHLDKDFESLKFYRSLLNPIQIMKSGAKQ